MANFTYTKNDKEWSKKVNNKNNGYCMLCSKKCTPAHIVSRRYKETRLVLENGVPLCIEHHNEFDLMSEAKHYEFAKLLVGDRIVNSLLGLIKGGEVVVWN